MQRRNLPPITPPSNQSFYSSPLPSTASEISTPEESISSLRNRLPSIDPFPSLPNINDFSRPITDIVDEKNKTTEITPKKIPLSPIGQNSYLKNYIKFFQMSTIQLRK